MPVSEHSTRIPLRPWLAAAFLALAGSFAACSFPEDDYGFASDTPKDAAPDVKLDGASDVKTEEASTLPDSSDEASEGGPDVIEEPDATQEADAPSDVAPEVGPDVLPDATEAGPDVIDAGPDAQTLPALNVWHRPTDPEPASMTMRSPRYPLAAGTATIYFGVQPVGAATGAKLYWWWSGETTPKEVPFASFSNDGTSEYWRATFPMPTRPIGTFRYYIEVSPKEPTKFATTYLFGNDSTSNKTTAKSAASASPYKPDVRLPTAAGDGGVSEIVITEIMINAYNPAPANENGREWFELYNAASVPVTLDGCKFGDNTLTHTIAAPELILWPGVYAVMGSSLDPALLGGFVADHMWTEKNLEFANSSSDLLRVMLPDDTVLDSMSWGTFGSDAKSWQHTTLPPSALANDSTTTWCISKKVYGLGTSYGTPMAATDLCAQ